MTSRTIGIHVARAVAVLCVAAALGGAARAEEGSAAQREACTPDVFQFCAMHIPNRPAIVNCLQHNSWRLSKKCKLVFDGKLK